MSTVGDAHSPSEILGVFDPTKNNYFCSHCRHYVHDAKPSPGMRECPTPGRPNPTGFGVHWKTPRPKRGGPGASRETGRRA